MSDPTEAAIAMATAEPPKQRMCLNCEFGIPLRDETGARAPVRLCKRNPPQLLLVPGAEGVDARSQWPVVPETEACGEYRERFSWIDV